jgi:hypothetical protein
MMPVATAWWLKNDRTRAPPLRRVDFDDFGAVSSATPEQLRNRKDYSTLRRAMTEAEGWIREVEGDANFEAATVADVARWEAVIRARIAVPEQAAGRARQRVGAWSWRYIILKWWPGRGANVRLREEGMSGGVGAVAVAGGAPRKLEPARKRMRAAAIAGAMAARPTEAPGAEEMGLGGGGGEMDEIGGLGVEGGGLGLGGDARDDAGVWGGVPDTPASDQHDQEAEQHDGDA